MIRFLALVFTLALSSRAATFPATTIRMLDSLWHVTPYGVLYDGADASALSQNGLILQPRLHAGQGGTGLEVAPHLDGYAPWVSSVVIRPTTMDSGGSTYHSAALDIMDCVGADSSCHAIRTRKGPVLIGDTLTAARLLRQGGGLQYHALLLRINRQISPDTDHVLVGYPPGGAVLHDTLPPLYRCLGCDYWFIQYRTASDSAWVIRGHKGDSINTDSIPGYDSVLADDRIDGFDSVSLRSNTGIARLHLLGQGDMWRVLEHHEEGAFIATLGGVSPPVFDTGWYTLDNLTSLRVRLRPMVGESNAAGTSFPISGMTSNFTDPGLDTGYIMTAAAIGQDSGVDVPLHCIAALSGAGIECRKSAGGAFSTTGRKGLRYGVEFTGRLARPPSHR